MSTLLKLFQLDPSERVRQMSKGTKQKLGIVAACMHDPPIMVLDEPSSGLDPLMQDVFVRFILEEKRRGKTIFVSSHNFDEIYRTCDRAGIIREGILVDIQDVHALQEKQRRRFTVTVGGDDDVLVDAPQLTDAEGRYHFADLMTPGEYYYLQFPPAAGFDYTEPNQGSDDRDSDVDPTTGCTPVFTPTSGRGDMTWDAGLVYYPAAILGQQFYDRLGNGIWDAGDPPL